MDVEGRGRGTYRRGQCRTVWRWGNARTEDLASCWSALEGHSKNRGARERKENGPRLPLSSAIARRDIREHGTVTHSSMRITNVVKRWLETIASRDISFELAGFFVSAGKREGREYLARGQTRGTCDTKYRNTPRRNSSKGNETNILVSTRNTK